MRREMRPMPTNWTAKLIAAALLLGVAGGGAYYWWRHRAPPQPPLVQAEPPLPVAPSAPQPAASAAPEIRHPLDGAASAPEGASEAPADLDRQVADALAALLGREDFLRFVLPEHFVRQAVATVDALGRDIAPPRLWPVTPTPGRFTTAPRDGAEWIAADNARRYAPFVRFASGVDPVRAAALYRRFYPRFQSAYEELGYPGRYFNDRLVEVIDLLLATPEPPAPPAVVLTQVRGPIPAARPWTRYEFADPSLEARPAGQKILLRVGAENAQALKAALRAFRAEIARP